MAGTSGNERYRQSLDITGTDQAASADEDASRGSPLSSGAAPRRADSSSVAARMILPVLAVACVLILAAGVYYVRWGFARGASWQGKPERVPIFLAFNDIGQSFAVHGGDPTAAVAQKGYDGQFFYYMARDPGVILACAQGPCPIDASPLREERILYPMTARVLALGNPGWIHAALFLLDFAAILVTVIVVAKLCMDAGASVWLAAAVGVFCGEMLGLLRDLADPYAGMWFALAIYFLRKDRPYWCAVAAAAAMLAREQMVLILPLLWLPWLAQRRWRTVAVTGVIAFAPFAAWQVALRLIFGKWGLTASTQTTHGIGLPFHGLWEYRNGPEFGVTVAFVAVPLVFTIVVALAWLWRFGPRALLFDPVPLMALLYCVLLTLTAYAEWEGMWNSARLMTPAVIMGALIVSRLWPSLRWSYPALLAVTAVAPLLMLPALF